jgi:hypothetical protein
MQTKPNNPPEIDRILTAFLQLDSDPLALAEHLGVTPFELLDFFDRPDVAERLEKLEALIARGERLRESKAKASALAALQRIVEDPEADPTERRRAAATILRAISKRRRDSKPLQDPPNSPEQEAQNKRPPAHDAHGSTNETPSSSADEHAQSRSPRTRQAERTQAAPHSDLKGAQPTPTNNTNTLQTETPARARAPTT